LIVLAGRSGVPAPYHTSHKEVMTMTDPHPILPWLTPPRRAYLYRVALASVPLLVLTGWMTNEAALYLVGFIAATLGTGTAAIYTPRKAEQHSSVAS
jgi:hypothetical protein